jgi:UDP-3-O-[3-hydroxymyristoyl] glucosamine N-acyltransferase
MTKGISPMDASLAKLAQLVGGTVSGDETILVEDIAPLHLAEDVHITFAVDLDHSKHLERTSAIALLTSSDLSDKEISLPAVFVDDVHAAVAKIVQFFRPAPVGEPEGVVSPAAHVDATAKLAEGVTVHPLAYVGPNVEIDEGSVIHTGARILPGCRIGKDTTIFPNAVLYEGTIVGDRCLVHANASLGAYGFGYSSSSTGHVLSAQIGYVELEDDVEIGSSSTVDRGTYGPTLIGEGTKIDNQVMVAHNCRIGKRNLLCAQVGIAGSSTTGDFVTMAGQAGVRDHVHIGAGAILGAKAGIINDVPPGADWVGIPATPRREQMRQLLAQSQLPQMRRQLREITDIVREMKERIVETAARIESEANDD